ncbi:MAG: DUF433 domain-containing protein [Candidatus Kapaibacterium sp.]
MLKWGFEFENKLKLGGGIYTIPEIADILRLPYKKVHTWLNKYWNGKLGKEFSATYSWEVNGSKAVNFLTLVEFYVFYLLAESGVKTSKALHAHKELSRQFDTLFPFACKDILTSIRTDGCKVFIAHDGNIMTLDGSRQFNLEFVKIFFKKIDFDNSLLASRFYPMGKEKSIIVDPERQFGHPVLGKTNIYPETIYNMYKGGEQVKFIAFAYEIDEKLVHDAIEYCEAS